MSNLSSNKIVTKPTTVVDHNFFIPPAVVDIRHISEEDPIHGTDDTNPNSVEQDITPDTIIYEVSPSDDASEELSDDIGDGDDGGSGLPIPASMSVVEQQYVVAENGTASVDVIVFTPDLPGVTQFDVRLTREDGNL